MQRWATTLLCFPCVHSFPLHSLRWSSGASSTTLLRSHSATPPPPSSNSTSTSTSTTPATPTTPRSTQARTRVAWARARPQGSEWVDDATWAQPLVGPEREKALNKLLRFVDESERLLVITGAGCSTASGIPDYRGPQGSYKHGHKPVSHGEFVGDPTSQQRYWARSLVGFDRFDKVRPNAAHQVLAEWEHQGRLQHVITQNVDGLHHAAGSRNVIDLHGRIDRVRCLHCGEVSSRRAMQDSLKSHNVGLFEAWVESATQRADGDAELDSTAYQDFVVPPCPACGTPHALKPDVVFFGDNVPRERVRHAFRQVEASDAVLVVGSSLEVYSAFRFVEPSVLGHRPLMVLNLGVTRAERAQLPLTKVHLPCDEALAHVAPRLSGRAQSE